MPKIRTCFYDLKRTLKEKRVLNFVEYELNQIENTIILKNVPTQANFIGYEEDTLIPIHECKVCKNRVYSNWLFCPNCSQKLKFKKGV